MARTQAERDHRNKHILKVRKAVEDAEHWAGFGYPLRVLSNIVRSIDSELDGLHEEDREREAKTLELERRVHALERQLDQILEMRDK